MSCSQTDIVKPVRNWEDFVCELNLVSNCSFLVVPFSSFFFLFFLCSPTTNRAYRKLDEKRSTISPIICHQFCSILFYLMDC